VTIVLGLRRARAVRHIAIGLALVPALAAPARAQLRLQPFVSGLHFPLEFVQDPTTPSLKYVVEKGGRIRVVRNGVLLPTPFLDVSAVIASAGEQGLLGLAFAPDYATSRRFFVNFTDVKGNTVVARFKRSTANALAADVTTRFDLRWGGVQRFITQPFPNHNGGHLAFGPDGYLYVGMGDGGSGDDPLNNGQNPASLLGKLLRIDVKVPDSDPNGYVVPATNPFADADPIQALPEIWAFGVRNPWKFTFDNPALGGTGAMLIGDVGQDSYEEVDYQPPAAGGRNYGWRVREGAHDHITSPGPAYLPLVDPITEYDHTVGNSITGGFVYRGTALSPFYRGRYFFADFVKGRVWSILLVPKPGNEVGASGLIEHTAELGGTATLGNISAFGVDDRGELYVVNYSAGTVLKVVDTHRHTAPPSDFDGDGRHDFTVWTPSSGVWSTVGSATGATTTLQWGTGTAPFNDVPVPGDYDGDGKTDIAVWRPSTGAWSILQSSNGGALSITLGASGDRPVPGDYDGDGRTDLAVWHPTTGVWEVRRSGDGATMTVAWGAGFAPYNDIPVPGDYDGDGIADIAVWRPSTGVWYILSSSTRKATSRSWGAGLAPYNDVPVHADYDGDGKTDIAVWRRSTGFWYVLRSATGTTLSRQWGAGIAPYNDIPVPGDYDGDGKADIAVWRPSTGIWYVLKSSNGAAIARQFGVNSDIPIP
jgi:glucose/arabinose dehydrogenase